MRRIIFNIYVRYKVPLEKRQNVLVIGFPFLGSAVHKLFVTL